MKRILTVLLALLLAPPAALAAEVPASKPDVSPAQNGESAKAKKNARRGKPADAETLKKRIPLAFPDFNYTADVVYKQVGSQALQMDILTPKDLKAAVAPVLVYIHGGGWAGGDRYRMARPDVSGVFNRCGKAGIICVSIEYRLNSEKVTAFDCAVDCKDALRFLVKNAAQYHMDPTRMGTIGGSAGGHLSLVTALGNPKDFPGDPALAGHDPAALRCEVAYYPATDFTDRTLAERFLGARAERMFGGPPEKKADLIRLLSPVHLIQKGSTPVYCFHGDKDTTLSVENARRLYAKGKAVGADIQYTEVKNGSHGFGTDCTPSVDEICTLAAKFVIERLTR
ncbi:MAG: alpha/beta hydrolase [Kiritimatiellaeota bacterium]|nr:alpha/beta hydrolase [Kiritimatiellota bacterium]